MGLFGSPNVKKLKDKKDIEGLIKALAFEKDKHIGQTAAEALISIGKPAVIPLCKALKDSNPSVCVFAAWSLGEIGDAQSIGALSIAMTNQNPFVRGSAAKALGEIGDASAVDGLCTAFKENRTYYDGIAKVDQSGKLIIANTPSDYQPGEKIVEALVKLGGASASPLCSIMIEAGSKAASSTIDANIFERTAELLVRIGESAVKPLCAVLKDNHWNVQMKAKEALVKIGQASVNPLITLLKDGNSSASSLAASALGEIGDIRAVDPLLEVLKDLDETNRAEAAKALITIYKGGKLDDAVKNRILSQSESITYVRHIDNDYNQCFPHDDYYETAEFPY